MMSVSPGLADAEPPRPVRGEGAGLAAALLVALGLHVGVLALLALWRSTTVVSPPGEQSITIDLAPQMVEAPSLDPLETSLPVAAPAEAAPIEPPLELPARAPDPDRVVEASSAPRLAIPVEPPPSAELVPTPAETLPPDTAATSSVEAEAALPPPDAVEARAAPEPQQPAKPAPGAPPKPLARPVERKPDPRTAREPVQRDRPDPVRPAAQPGPAGPSSREAQRGAASREDTGGAAASADPNAIARYAAQLAAALRNRLRYPVGTGVSGTATLRFTLHRSGRVVSASLVRSAGHPALDAAALATAAPGSTLPAAPDAVPQAQITISVPLRFDAR